MRDEVRRRCELLIQNRDTVQEAFKWGNGLLNLSAAYMITSKEKHADVTKLKLCKDLIKEKTGMFSNFKGNAHCAITAMLSVSSDAESLLADGLQVHKMFKGKLWDSAYLPMAAMSIARLAAKERYEEIVEKTKEIYDRIKKEQAVHRQHQQPIHKKRIKTDGEEKDLELSWGRTGNSLYRCNHRYFYRYAHRGDEG